MPSLERIGRRNTTIEMQTPGIIGVTYCETVCVTIAPGFVTLNPGARPSYTIKMRMNQAAKQFGLSYHVREIKGKWFVEHAGKLVPFPAEAPLVLPVTVSNDRLLEGALK